MIKIKCRRAQIFDNWFLTFDYANEPLRISIIVLSLGGQAPAYASSPSPFSTSVMYSVPDNYAFPSSRKSRIATDVN